MAASGSEPARLWVRAYRTELWIGACRARMWVRACRIRLRVRTESRPMSMGHKSASGVEGRKVLATGAGVHARCFRFTKGKDFKLRVGIWWRCFGESNCARRLPLRQPRTPPRVHRYEPKRTVRLSAPSASTRGECRRTFEPCAPVRSAPPIAGRASRLNSTLQNGKHSTVCQTRRHGQRRAQLDTALREDRSSDGLNRDSICPCIALPFRHSAAGMVRVQSRTPASSNGDASGPYAG